MGISEGVNEGVNLNWGCKWRVLAELHMFTEYRNKRNLILAKEQQKAFEEPQLKAMERREKFLARKNKEK